MYKLTCLSIRIILSANFLLINKIITKINHNNVLRCFAINKVRMSDLQETKESISDNLQQVISLLEKHKQQNSVKRYYDLFL